MAPALLPTSRSDGRALLRLRALVLAALLAALPALGGGCASFPPRAMPAPSPAEGFPLLAPASYGGSAQFEQVLHAAHGDQEVTIQCLVAISPQRITVLGLTAMGQRIFSLDYDGTHLVAERSAFAPERVQPQRILADLQLALWPLPALQAALADGPWQVSEPRPGLRRLRQGAALVAEVHQAGGGRFWLSQLRDGYSLDIQSREVAP